MPDAGIDLTCESSSLIGREVSIDVDLVESDQKVLTIIQLQKTQNLLIQDNEK